MKITNAIKKLERAGFKVTETEYSFVAEKAGCRLIEFHRNGGGSESVVCIRTRRKTDKDDSMTDYCAGVFHKNITQAIESAPID